MPSNPKLVPQCLEAERALLGCVLVDNQAIGPALEMLEKDDFYSHANRMIYDTMLTLAASHRVIDYVTVSEMLAAQGVLENVGGTLYVTMLTEGVPIGCEMPTGEYARIIKNSSAMRHLITTCDELRARAMTGAEDLQALLDDAQTSLLDLGAGQVERERVTSFRDAAVSLVRMCERGDLGKIETGIVALDKLTGGFLAGELVVFTAETGTGKTVLAQQVRRFNCGRGRHTLFASAEMTREQLLARELPVAAGVPTWKMRRPDRLTPGEFDQLIEALPCQCEHCKILDGEITMARVASVAKQMQREGSLGLVIVDYDELVASPGKDDNERQGAVATASKALAVHLGVPLILVSQLRKLLTGEDRHRPTLDRLYGAGAKRKHAAVVVFVHRQYVESLDSSDLAQAELYVLKNRNGRVGAIDASFNISTLAFAGRMEDELDEGEPA